MAGMLCRSCGTENPAGARFCMECGQPMARACPSCGTELPPSAKFCPECGAQAGGAGSEPARRPAVAAATPAEERRQATVLFADLSGYTAVAETMDPEAVKALVGGCLQRLGAEVERFGGTIDKYIGDNVMALFGAPVAHEDDAERAVRAALGMQEAMAEINAEAQREYGVSFALRVGVNTGEVLAGAVGDAYTVTGDAVNVAARLQAAAQPGSIVVAERTVRATDDAIEYRDLGPLTLKGKSAPVAACEVVGAAAPTARRVTIASESPLIGRHEELGLLESVYSRVATDRRPHLVTVVGEAGVGKSRLLREAERRLGARDPAPAFREGRCLPYGSSVVFWALGAVLRSECEIVDEDDAEVAWGKLTSHLTKLLSRAEPAQRESAERKSALIARLLGFAERGEESEPGEEGDPARLRESFFSAVRSVIEAMAEERPAVLVFEDIHWADDGMLDLVEHLAQWARAPVLIICLARDELLESRPGWGGGQRRASNVFLEPLTDSQTRELVTALAAGEGDERVVSEVIERAGGNPLFVEEIVRALSEDGDSGEAVELPDNVQALLAARLDSLEPFERRLLAQAAVVGRTFWADSLATVAEEDGQDLQAGLESLQRKDLVVPETAHRLAGQPELAFKHVLIRDVAYAMLPKSIRARKHFEVAGFIEKRLGDRSDEVVALLAEHYGRAAALAGESRLLAGEQETMRERAVHFLEAAGDAAGALYSNSEALAHFQQARELLTAGGDTSAGHDIARVGEKQGDVALRLGRVDAAIEVWSQCLDHHRGREDLTRVADLHRKVGAALSHRGDRQSAIEHHQKGINLLKDGPACIELVRLYEEAAWLYMQTGDNMLAIYAAEKSLRLAERLGAVRAASRAHGIFGRVFGRIGDAAKARDNLERSVELARGSDDGETILALLALGHHLETFEADYTAADEGYAEGLVRAERVGDVPAQVELQSAIAQLAVHRADWEVVAAASDAAVSLAEREGLVGKLSLPYSIRAVLCWRDGDWEAAQSLLGRAHELAEQVGWSEVAYYALYGMGVTLRDRGELAASDTALARALDVCERAGLIAQSIQAGAARAVTLALAGRHGGAREAAEEAVELAERLHYPVGHAAALEADGVTGGPEGVELLRLAQERWSELGRKLDAARCQLLVGRALRAADSPEAAQALEQARAAYEQLGVFHQAQAAGELAAA